MTDYYDPHARLSLSRPILVAGQIGSGTRLIGRTLCARTGLPFVEVDRQIEHEAGRSLARIATEDGLNRLANWSRSVLERLAIQRPWAVVVLDRAWPARESSSVLRRRFDFVSIQRDPAFLFERVEEVLHSEHHWILTGHENKLESEHDLECLHAERDPLLREAGIMLDAGAQHEHRVASILLDALEPVAGAERI